MEQDNEKFQDSLNSSEEQKNTTAGHEFRPAPGRSPRPRIHASSQHHNNGSYDSQSFNRRPSTDDGAFRPEGFGASLQSAQQRPFRQRTSYYNNNGYNQQRQQPYYQQRPRYNQDDDAQQQRPRYNQGPADGAPRQYQQRPRQYQPRPRYNEQQGEGTYQYQQRPRYNQQRNDGGYSYQQRPYGQQGGYQKTRRPRTPDYDPSAKYSMKKRIEYKEVNYDPNEPVRLNKFLANAGVCSRREADEFIQAGVVSVNGNIVTELGTKVLRTDEVRFHDQPVNIEKKVYVLLNKPKDYVTTSDDPQQRKTVMDLVKGACPERIYPVGRLDRNTTGVLLLTNDGDLASKLTHPKYLKKKIYHVYLDRNVTAHDLQQIAEGIQLDDGEIKADDVQYASPTDKKQVGIEIHSGKNRIVRRIFEALGYKVTKLDRVQFAGLTKKNLRRGDWRYLTEVEVDRLRMGAYE